MSCLFSGVDKRKESVKDLRARNAYLERLFDKVRSAQTDRDLNTVLEEVRGDAALVGRMRVENSRDRAASMVVNSADPSRPVAVSPSTKKRRVRYGDTDTDFRSDGSEIDGRAEDPRSGIGMLSKEESDFSDSVPAGDDDFVTAQLTEMVDRWASVRQAATES